MPLLLSCEVSPHAAGPQVVGGKAWNLLRLREAGFLVPRFWVVPAVGEALAARPVPPALAKEILQALPPDGLFAVRSSAVAEDSRQHSFAGVLESVLNVRRPDVADAIQRVWASAFSARALAYRQRKGLTLEQTATAVIVQEMVQAVCAGVLFTRDPEDGARRLVVSAGLGLGQGVVDGSVEADTYRLDREGGAWSSDVRVKRSRLVLADREQGGTREEEVPWRRARRAALRPRHLRDLGRLGRDVERALGGPQDIEWAKDARGRFVVLQARPIVGVPRREGERRLWDNANIVESYPGLTLPLTFSFASRSYRRTFERVARSFGAPPARPDLYDGLIGLIDGRVYYNLLAWYEMFAGLPGSDRYRESWDRLIGVGEPGARPRVRVTWWTRAGALVASLAILLRVRSLRPRFGRRFDALRARFQDAGRDEATVDEVLGTFRALEEDAGSFWHLTLQNDFCALKFHQWMATLLGRWCPGRAPGLLSGLRCGPEGVESVAPARSLIALVEAVRRDSTARSLFEGGDDDRAIWETLDGGAPRWRELREVFRRHLDDFGDRSVAELKLETVTFEEDPPRLVGLVRRSLSAGLSAAEVASRSARPFDELQPGLVHGLARRLVFRFVWSRARAALRAREEMRLARTRLFGMVRRLFHRLGDLLAQQGLLDSPRDVHYLAVGELLDLARGSGVTAGIKDLVALRKAEYARFADASVPPRLETAGVPRAQARRLPTLAGDSRRSLTGKGCSAGIASGPATVVVDPERVVASRDRILIAPSTDPGWVFLMMSSAGIVVERGSLLSHTAIVGRELGIPTVVGATGATRLIPEGSLVHIDGGTGDVRWA